jgi:hypothetical protein
VISPISLLATFATLSAIYPRISINADPPLSPENAFTTPFVVTYDGLIPIRDVLFHCVYENVGTDRLILFQEMEMVDPNRSPGTLYWGDSETFYCGPPGNESTSHVLPGSSIVVLLSYKMWGVPFWERAKGVRFIFEFQSNRSLRWIKHASFWDYRDLSRFARIMQVQNQNPDYGWKEPSKQPNR